eukprot:Hpha_TRINITY_DN3034_c0_g1::TRINITY_DN3034_c0_g1_i1::g.138648::m.138648
MPTLLGLLDPPPGGVPCRVAVNGCLGCQQCERGRGCAGLGVRLVVNIMEGGQLALPGRLPAESPGECASRVPFTAPTGEVFSLDLWQKPTPVRQVGVASPGSPRAEEEEIAVRYDAGLVLCSPEGGATRAVVKIRDSIQELRACGVPEERIVAVGMSVSPPSATQHVSDVFTPAVCASEAGIPCVFIDAAARDPAAEADRQVAVRALALLLAKGKARAADACAMLQRASTGG